MDFDGKYVSWGLESGLRPIPFEIQVPSYTCMAGQGLGVIFCGAESGRNQRGPEFTTLPIGISTRLIILWYYS